MSVPGACDDPNLPEATAERVEVVRVNVEGLPITRITPPVSDGRPTLVATLGAFAVAADEQDRYHRLAASQRRTVLLVETPGWHPDHAPLTARARRDLLGGDFSGVAAQQWAAVAQLEFDEPVSLVGYSLGASTATAMAGLLTHLGRPPTHLSLVEPVAIEAITPLTLLRRNRWEAHHSDSSRSQRRKGWPTPVGTHQLDMALLAWGLTRGGLCRELPALAAAGVPLTLLRGAGSRLCPSAAFADLVTAAAATGGRLRSRVYAGRNHSLWQGAAPLAGLTELIG